MAEALVSFLLNKFGEFLLRKISGFEKMNMDKDLNWLKHELSMMKAFLRDADRSSSRSETVKEWVAQLKHIAFRIEDLLDDTCKVGIEYRLVFAGWKFSREFPSIKEEIESIMRRGKAYGLLCAGEGGGETSSGTTHSRENREMVRTHRARLEEPEMVGFDEEMMKLRELLLSEERMMRRHSVISIVGLAGSGKSTLARNAYNHFKCYFDCHAWVVATKSLQMKDVLKEMCKGFRESRGDKRLPERRMESMDDIEIKRMICSYLSGKRYALVLDDIRDISIWDALKSALPFDSRSKIIFTSPFMMHSLVNDNCHFLIIKQLSPESAWKLFCWKAFQYTDPPSFCPDHLRDLGQAIVKRCGGLPLAILLMGGVMSKKRGIPIEWKHVLDNFHHSLGSFNQILQASYSELPSQLKYCYLYCCTFPKSSKIKRSKLIQLWIAEGFIEAESERTLEDIANDYYIQLIEGCFLQPIISDFDGEPLACEVHDIMHEFAKPRFQEEFGILGESQCHEVEQKRRLAIHDDEKKNLLNGKKCFKIRSLLMFNVNKFPLSPLEKIPKMFKYLRVLSLEGIPIERLPNGVYGLFFLRYLGLRGTRIKELSGSLLKLENLETLDIRDTRIEHLPSNIDMLGSLKHLLLRKWRIFGNNDLVDMPIGPSKLHSLLGVKIDKCSNSGGLPLFTDLQRLHINIWDMDPEQVCAFITQLVRLCSLKLYYLKIESDGKRQFGMVKLENLSQPPQYLDKIVLGGILQELPQWFCYLKSLRIVRLVNSLLVADPLSNLSLLPNLVSLSLYHAYVGEQMGCEQGGFPKLRHLHLASLSEFTEWSAIEGGTMPCLKFLSIVDCTKLRMLPQGFETLKSLQSLEVIEMPDEFMERLMTEDHSKINHISKIIHLPRTGVMPQNSQASTSGSAASHENI